jgi:hypothetical protein
LGRPSYFNPSFYMTFGYLGFRLKGSYSSRMDTPHMDTSPLVLAN